MWGMMRAGVGVLHLVLWVVAFLLVFAIAHFGAILADIGAYKVMLRYAASANPECRKTLQDMRNAPFLHRTMVVYVVINPSAVGWILTLVHWACAILASGIMALIWPAEIPAEGWAVLAFGLWAYLSIGKGRPNHQSQFPSRS